MPTPGGYSHTQARYRGSVMAGIFVISNPIGSLFMPCHDLIDSLFLQKKMVCLYDI